jgi:uncharacterized protein
MRLTPSEVEIIKNAVHSLDSSAAVYLFGSRVDDMKQGGDIDLLIMSDTLTGDDVRRIRLALHDKLGEQKLDILIAKDTSEPFVRIAFREGVLL